MRILINRLTRVKTIRTFAFVLILATLLLLVALPLIASDSKHSRQQANAVGSNGNSDSSNTGKQPAKVAASNRAVSANLDPYSFGSYLASFFPMNYNSPSSMYPSNDPNAIRMLRDSINKATELINNYRQNGLAALPSLPNLPGVNTVMRIPDKLLRAELSMLQDEIRMAQEMMQNPLVATMNAPRDMANMLSRMAAQLEQ